MWQDSRAHGEHKTLNNDRIWALIGPQTVKGPSPSFTMPNSSRTDTRPYEREAQFFARATAPEARPRLPPDLYGPWSAGYDVANGDVGRELRGAVREERGAPEIDQRLAGRIFEHQWIPAAVTKEIAERKIMASEQLRPAQDDYRKDKR
jgi:hypothetical protein